jgi:hypothetical protein
MAVTPPRPSPSGGSSPRYWETWRTSSEWSRATNEAIRPFRDEPGTVGFLPASGVCGRQKRIIVQAAALRNSVRTAPCANPLYFVEGAGEKVKMALKKSELYNSLWASCDELRGGMDASQYKGFVLVLLFTCGSGSLLLKVEDEASCQGPALFLGRARAEYRALLGAPAINPGVLNQSHDQHLEH